MHRDIGGPPEIHMALLEVASLVIEAEKLDPRQRVAQYCRARSKLGMATRMLEKLIHRHIHRINRINGREV